ncbi:hypothetical protein CAPTEDRAFT_124512 [Capitella teleta]|uniref:DUF1279 domain-containing protein n=1 Tax=Capitella teleta TaxID=283909 RepID=R7TMZ5_CAPTE|nr:hypothetical protein CAPTEDRAFT_124512 [Capitella teleta]|eukprot:ELT94887.1 hypothetical protein CAPTEDRAFT_124512 [Capitella teleta]
METRELRETDEYKQLSFQGKLKRMIAEYGVTVVVVHMTSCLSQLGISFFAVYMGLDIAGCLKSIGINSSLLDSQMASGAAWSFAIAYIAYKILFPLRFGITLTVTPVLVKFLRRRGFIKPP